VISVVLPVDTPDSSVTVPSSNVSPDEPLVIVVGSHEPRKNHDAIVFAAERLWAEGIRFHLRFIGGGSRQVTHRFDRRARALARRGHSIEVRRSAKDNELLASYHEARFTVFPSLDEGFGLPLAESLALAVPAITSDYGSTAEIARDGGCLVVNPRDDDAIVGAMRTLLTDDKVHERLVTECRARPVRTWSDFADDLWNRAVVPLQRRER
jgi:glycosyltransferase involved in cell wall biosynthesis